MIVYDIHGNRIDTPDLTLGMLIEKTRPVMHQYVVTQPEVGYWNTVNLDPETGGREVEWIVETPEKGVWRTYDYENNIIEFDGEYPSDTTNKTIPDTQTYFIYQEYTDQELEQMGKKQAMDQYKYAVQMFAQSLTDEQALVIPLIYPAYEVGKTYKVDELLTYGENPVGDPQLYRVIQDHTSQENWTPDATPALYSPIGLTDKGYPVWAQPTGAHDAYNTGDIVEYNGTLYKSLIDGNVWAPDAYPAGWETYVEVATT